MDVRRNLFAERVVLQWHRLPKEVMQSLPLEVFKICVDVALSDTVSGHGGDGLMVGIGDLSSLSNLNDSVWNCTKSEQLTVPLIHLR